MFDLDRKAARAVFVEAWRKHRAGLPLQPLEAQLAAIIGRHPEYHALLSGTSELELNQDSFQSAPGGNPFLHLSLHSALAEQLATDRPQGILEVYRRLCTKRGDAHEAEHLMMECLGEVLWQAQSAGTMPDERTYLSELRKLVK